MNNIPSVTLDQLYEYINKALKGSKIPNEEVKVVARVKLPDEPKRFVYLSVGKAELVKYQIPDEERKHMAGLYPPKERAQIIIDCDVVGSTTE